MINPILQSLNAARAQNNPMNRLTEIKQLLSGQSPDMLWKNLMMTNPQFASFVEANKGKSAEQIARENGLDPNILRNLFR